MRFFKIFLVSFFALIGSVGAIIGVMFLTGALNEKVVEPESIAFDQPVYNVDGDFMVTITTPTEGTTENELTLSLKNVLSEDGGYLTDGVIIIPEKAKIGVPFMVQVYVGPDAELGKEWIVGGSSVISADSESFMPNEISATVNVDVPVDSISIKNYTNNSSETVSETFSYGETFYSEVVFAPERSKFKYSSTELKHVYFDVSTNKDGVIQENTVIKTEMQAQKLYNKTGFDVLNIHSGVNIYAYCFENSILEDQYLAEYGEENVNNIIGALKLSTDGKSSTSTLDFTNRSVSSFSIKYDSFDEANHKYLAFNQITNIYANYYEGTNLSLGINIADKTNDQSLQNKLKDVGISVFVNDGSNYREATDSEVMFVNYMTGAQSTNFEVYDGVKYYFPTIVASNVDKSYWSVVSTVQNSDVQIKAYLFERGDTIDVENRLLSTGDLSSAGKQFQRWTTGVLSDTVISWNSTENINLIVIDNTDSNKVTSEEIDISERLVFNKKGTYQTVRYLAYLDNEMAASSSNLLSYVLPDCVVTTKYNTSLGISNKIYELKSSIIKPIQSMEFNIIAVIVRTDYLGNIIQDATGDYIVYSQTVDTGTNNNQAIRVNVTKTIKNLTYYLEVDNPTALMNEQDVTIYDQDGKTILHQGSYDANGNLTKLAFASSTGSDRIFTVVFAVNADSMEALKKEIRIFIDAYTTKKFTFAPYNGEEESSLLIIPGRELTTIDVDAIAEEEILQTNNGYSYEFRFQAYANMCEQDTELRILYKYHKTATTITEQPINVVKFVGELQHITFVTGVDWATIEMYDGKTDDIKFTYDKTNYEDKSTWLSQEVTLSLGDALSGTSNIFYAASSQNYVVYKLDTEDVTAQVADDNGFLIECYDKYGNLITNNADNYVVSLDSNGAHVQAVVVSSSNPGMISDSLYFTAKTAGRLKQVGVNHGTISNGIWTSDTITTGFDVLENHQAGDFINIERYGKVGTANAIQITGNNGLLSVRYSLSDLTYELCNILQYSFVTYLSNYQGVFSYDEESGALTVLKHLKSDITLKINATCELGLSYTINLTIKPNVSITFERITPQGDFDPGISEGFYSLYSDNDVEFNVNITMYLQEAFSIYTDLFKFKNNSDETTVSTIDGFDHGDTESTKTIQLVVNYSYLTLGEQTFNISTASYYERTNFDFVRELKLMVHPNIKYNNNQTLITQNITFDKLNDFKTILELSDLTRIVGTSTIDTNGLRLEFEKETFDRTIYDSVYLENTDKPLQQNIFALSDYSKICAINTLRGNYLANVNLYYGNSFVGAIKVNIKTAISPITTSEYYSKMFAKYDGVECLVLVSGNEYYLDYLKNLFYNASELKISENLELLRYDIDSLSYKVSNLTTYTFSLTPNSNIFLTLTHKIGTLVVAEISYPILFSPLNISYVTYQGGEDTVHLNSVQNDFSRLLSNKNYLFGYNVYDAYNSGGGVSLLNTDGHAYGLSEEVLLNIKNNLLGFEVMLEDQSGNMQLSENFVTYNADQYLLYVPSLSEDKFVYFVIKDFSANANIIGLYRIKLLANSAINVYYPYATTYYQGETLEAEYIYEGDYSVVIDFARPISEQFPNAGHKRISLEQLNASNEFEETQEQYVVEYKVARIIHNNNIINNNTTENANTIFRVYGVYFEGTELNITKGTLESSDRIFEIIVSCTIYLDNTNMGGVEYKIQVNNTAIKNYNLKQTVQTPEGVQNIDYETTDITIQATEKYDFSDIKLFFEQGGSISEEKNLPLNYYFYIENANWQDYLSYDVYYDEVLQKTVKTLSIKNSAVSEKQVVFVYYTVYGELLRQNITFKTNFQHSFKDGSDIQEVYNVYADMNINIAEILQFTHNGNNVPVSSEYIKFWIDEGEEQIGGTFLFKQTTTNPVHAIRVELLLQDMTSSIYNENYHFSFNICVLQSIKNNSPNMNNVSISLSPERQVYSEESIEFNNIVCTTDTTLTATGFLFSSINAEVLEGYEITTSLGDHEYVQLSAIQEDENASGDTIFTISISFKKSPADEITVIVPFIMYNSTTDVELRSYLKFILVPDFQVNSQYPTANSNNEAAMDKELIYLDKEDYAKLDAEQNIIFDNSLNKSITFALNQTGYFETQRLLFDLTENGASIDYNRVTVKIQSAKQSTNTSDASNVIIAYDENTTTSNAQTVLPTYKVDSNGVVHDEIGAVKHFLSPNSVFKIQWASTTAIQNTLTETITFVVLVDEVVRETYTITVSNKISDIFSIEINNLYEGALQELTAQNINSSVNAEIFYVDENTTEAVLSNNTAKLSFTPYTSMLNKKLTFFIEAEELALGELAVAETTITNIAKQNVYLGADINFRSTSVINSDLSNLFIRIDGDETKYYFTPQGSEASVYEEIINQGASSVELKQRLSVLYNKQPVTYEKLYKEVLVSSQNTGTVLSQFFINRASSDVIETSSPVEAKIVLKTGDVIGTYFYEVKYDFEIEKSLDNFGGSGYASDIEITAPENQSSLTDLFGISGITADFDENYFSNHNVMLSAQVVMVTNTLFDSAALQQNIKYLDISKINYLKEFYPNIAAPSSNSNVYLSLSSKTNSEGLIYDFDISVYGAENDGNLAFILVNFGVQGNENAQLHKLIRLKLQPNTRSILLYTQDTNDPNTATNPYRIEYTATSGGYSFATQTLGYANIDNYNNIIIEESVNYPTAVEMCGEIAKFVQVNFNQRENTISISQLGDEVAYLGDKEGFIKITNKFGYTVYFYLYLSAAWADNAIRLPGVDSNISPYLNTNEGTNNQYFTGTEMKVVDANDIGNDIGEYGGIVVQNFKSAVIDNGANWDYVISYEIDELGFTQNNTFENKNNNSFIIPVIQDTTKIVNLKIIIDVKTSETSQERVVLALPIEIAKRFVVKQVNSSELYVRENIDFNITDYILVEDQSEEGECLGDVSISDKTKTLKISASLFENNLTIIAKHNASEETHSLQLTVGYDHNQNPLTAVGTGSDAYYYHVLSEYDEFAGLKIENYSFTMKGSISADKFSFVEDKILYLTTTKTSAGETVYVRVNNGNSSFYVPFTLNKNGKQFKSIYEEIVSGRILDEEKQSISSQDRTALLATSAEGISGIYTFQVSSSPISVSDMQKIKNFAIVNDTVRVKVKGGYGGTFGVKIYLKVYYSSNLFVISDERRITNNNAHYEYFSVSEILGEYFDISKTYKIELIYDLETENQGAITMEYDVQQTNGSLVTYHAALSSVRHLDDYVSYCYVIEEFKFTETSIDNVVVLSALDFSAKVKEEEKYYLVKYEDYKLVENIVIKYQVTPKYYVLDNAGHLTSSTKIVYANQYSVSQSTQLVNNVSKDFNVYEVMFDVWASDFYLLDGNQNIISTVNNGSDLVFELENENGVPSTKFATLTQNTNNLRTTYDYLENTYHFYVAVYTTLSTLSESGEEQLIRVGTIQILLEHNNVYVENLGIYKINITHPSHPSAIINTNYEFKEQIVSVNKLINENPELAPYIDAVNGTIQINDGTYVPITECNIEVVTIVDAIYSVDYDSDGYLNLKLKINETLSAQDKVVTLKLFKKLRNTESVYETFANLSFVIRYANNEYYLDLSSTLTPDTTLASSSKDLTTGVHNIKVKLSKLASNFIGEDYVYSAELLTYYSEDAGTEKRILYPNNKLADTVDIQEDANDYIFIKVSFTNTPTSTQEFGILGFKYTSAVKELGGAYGYAVDISNITTISGFNIENIKTFSVVFIKAVTIQTLNANTVFLITTPDGANKKYSLATLTNYQNNGTEVLFELTDVAGILTSASTFEVYENSVATDLSGNKIPTIVDINPGAQANTVYYYCINSSSAATGNLFALSTSSLLHLYFDVSSVLAAANTGYVCVKNLSSSITGTISSEGIVNFKGYLNTSSYAFFNTAAITKEANLNHNSCTTTIYSFDNNVAYVSTPFASSFIEVQKTTETRIDLTPLVGTVNNNKYYGFEFTSASGEISYLTIKGSVLGNFDMASLNLTGIGKNYFRYISTINFENIVVQESGSSVMFAVYDATGLALGVNSLDFAYISPNVFKTLTNPLIINGVAGSLAKVIVAGESISFNIPSQTASYVSVNLNNENTLYYAFYYESDGVYEVNVTQLDSGEFMSFNVGFNGFSNFNPSNSLSLISDTNGLSLTVYDSVNTSRSPLTVNIPDDSLTLTVNNIAEALGSEIVLNLKINKSNT